MPIKTSTMKTTLHTRIDSPQQEPNFGVLIDRMMQQYAHTYRKTFAGLCRLAPQIRQGELSGSLAGEAQKHLYPKIKQDTKIAQQMQALLTSHLTQEQLQKTLNGNVLLDSWTSEYAKSILSKALGEYEKFKALTKTQVVQLTHKKVALMQFIADKTVQLHEATTKQSTCPTAPTTGTSKRPLSEKQQKQKIQNLKRLIANKHVKLQRLTKSIARLETRLQTGALSVCFGSKILLSQNPLHHGKHRRLKGSDNAQRGKEDTVGTQGSNALSPFGTHAHWKLFWQMQRDNVIYSAGDAKAIGGNNSIQYDAHTQTLRIRLSPLEALQRLIQIGQQQGIALVDLLDTKKVKLGTLRKQSQWMSIANVTFAPKHRQWIELAQQQGQPLTVSVVKKLTPQGKRKWERAKAAHSANKAHKMQMDAADFGYYVHITMDEPIAPLVGLTKRPKCMGVDLNVRGLAYCVVKADGNKLADTTHNDQENNPIHHQAKPLGFVPWSISEGCAAARQKSVEHAIHQLVQTALDLGVYTIAIENLSFHEVKAKMRAGYVQGKEAYHKMISGLPTAAFMTQIQRQCERSGITLLMVNPAYSSVGGYTKYGLANGLPVDIAAALWIARQGVLGGKTLLEKALQTSATKSTDSKESSKLSQKNRPLSQTMMVKHYSERCQFPALPWAHQRNMPNPQMHKPQKLEWKQVADHLKGNRKLWKQAFLALANSNAKGVTPFILQGQSPSSGKPLKRGRVPLQGTSSSRCSGDSSNTITTSKNHTV